MVSLVLAGTGLVDGFGGHRPAEDPTEIQRISHALQGTIQTQGGTVAGTTSGSSSFTASCSPQSTGQSPEHVWAWTPSVSGLATISTCGANTRFDTVLYVATSANGSVPIACADDSPSCNVWNG